MYDIIIIRKVGVTLREVLELLDIEEKKIKKSLKEYEGLYRNTPNEGFEVKRHHIQRQMLLKQGELRGIKQAKAIVANIRRFIKTGIR